MKHRIAAVAATACVATACCLGFAFAAGSSLPRADLTAEQVASAGSAAPGQVVTFTSTAVDLGPARSQVDAVARRARGLRITRTHCNDVSPDGPGVCEFGELTPFQPEQMTVRAKITGTPGSIATLTVCAQNEGGQTDPVKVNDCSTTFVQIVAPPAART